MYRILWTALLGLAALLQPVQAASQAGPDAHQVFWQRSLEDAVELAKEHNLPIFVAVNMDGESASDRIVNENYRDPEFVAATRGCVCLVASVFRHNPRDYDNQGRRIPCPRLGEVTCGEHMALEPVLFERFLADGERVAPRHTLILPDGTKAFDLSLCFDLRDIDRALIQAVGTDFVTPASPAMNEDKPSWATLAVLRDHRGRAQFESALMRTPDGESWINALKALAANGNAGSIDALRLAAVRLPGLSSASRTQVLDTVRALNLARPFALTLRDALTAPGPVPGVLDATGCSTDLPILAALDGETPATRSLLLAYCAQDNHGDDAARLLRLLFGPDADALEAALRAHGGGLPIRDVLAQAEAVTRQAGQATLPAIGTITDAMPTTAELEREAAALDVELASNDAPELHARFAKTSLDLARRRLEVGATGVQLLLEDAERNYAIALEREPKHSEWWIERARTAYFSGRFVDEVEFGARALALAEPSDSDSALTIEAYRWIGDGHARLLAERSGKDPAVELVGILDGLRALGAVAASRFGDGTDWTSLASFVGALGLQGQEIKIALCGAERLPASAELRQVLNNALWSVGRIEWAPLLAEQIATKNADSLDAVWHTGYAWILCAESQRRREAALLAIQSYMNARAHFESAAARNPDWRESCTYYIAMAWLGEGLANVRLGLRERAADCLAAAAATGVELAGASDGLGYDVLDLVDKLLEWRATDDDAVDPLALLDRLEAVAPGTAFWASAISDSELREALRADGRNPERAERDGVDAAGNPVRQITGLPWAEGDAYLDAAILAGRRALPLATADVDTKPLAQACTIQAERLLELGRLDGVQAALAEAADVLGMAALPPDADKATLRQRAQELRGQLGEARPRFRPGR